MDVSCSWGFGRPGIDYFTVNSETKICKSIIALSPHSTTPTRHPRDDPREDVGVGVVECGLHAAKDIAKEHTPGRSLLAAGFAHSAEFL